MITAQDIREKTFEKAKFNNGYDMSSVDEFIEELANEITAAQKENSVLKSKMKVLAAKIEEYRGNEEALQQALLSAQKLALQIESDARARADAMIAEAQAKVDEKLGGIDALAADQEKRLEAAKAATAEFCKSAREMCLAQIAKLEAIESENAAEKDVEVEIVEEDDSDVIVADADSTISFGI